MVPFFPFAPLRFINLKLTIILIYVIYVSFEICFQSCYDIIYKRDENNSDGDG